MLITSGGLTECSRSSRRPACGPVHGAGDARVKPVKLTARGAGSSKGSWKNPDGGQPRLAAGPAAGGATGDPDGTLFRRLAEDSAADR